MEEKSKKHLIVGFTGGIGRATAKALVEKGESVIVFSRDREKTEKYAEGLNVEIVSGDASDLNDLSRAAKDASTLYYCVNVPYPMWYSQSRELLKASLQIAKQNQMKFIFPGNVYVYGKPQFNPVTEGHPHYPNSRKGRIRVEMENMIIQAGIKENLDYSIVRFPDFYGPYVVNGFSEQIFINALKGKKLKWFGDKNVKTEFIFIEDAGKAMAIAGLSEKSNKQHFNVPGFSPITAKHFFEKLISLSGKKSSYSVLNSSFLVSMAGLFNKMAYEFQEMMYLKQEELLLTGELFKYTFGQLPATDYETGIKKTFDWVKLFYKP
ncbi:MAG: SDR family NAD(P)-dependent oxidoreductase [Ignavibacteriaceae bacterium]|nr:SDR family NAD(P)-dependent oxidoreductase [Ignavibacteriaceae bacterium]